MSEDKGSGPDRPSEVPEFYVNQTAISVSAYDVLIAFSEAYSDQLAPRVQVRTSIEHAWVLAKVLDRVIKIHIRDVGPIHLPSGLLDDLGLVEQHKADMEETDG